jgi:hypothetical protein
VLPGRRPSCRAAELWSWWYRFSLLLNMAHG